MATDKIVAEYTVKVDLALKNLDKLAGKVDKIDKERKKTQDGFKEMSTSLSASFAKVGAAIGVAFGTQQIVAFGKEAIQLAAKAEGIERAFAKLNNPRLLDDLRKATRGTVSDLQLMQQAVRAQNFKVPLEQLAGFFKFATNRAIETGESVDYLVNSIIDGIGRKSTLVLDNLGISATELQEEIKKTGDFGEAAGNIIARELEKAGDVADTTATKTAQLATEFENLKVKGGDALITLGTGLATTLGIIDEIDPKLKGINAAMGTLTRWRMEDLNDGTKTLSDLYLEIEAQLKEVNKLKAEEEALGTSSNDRQRRTEIIGLLQVEEARLDALRGVFERYSATLKEVTTVEEKEIRNLQLLNAEIKKLTDERLAGDVSIERTKQINLELIALNEERARLLANIRNKANDQQMQEIESLAISEVEAQQTATDDIIADYEYRNNEVVEGIKKRDAELARLAEERKAKEAEIALQITQQVLGEFSSIIGSIAQIQQNKFREEQQLLQEQLEQGVITREEFDRKQAESQKKAAQAAKDAAIFQATISTAQGVISALGAYPFSPANIALSALVAAAGAAQIAAIASQPLPQFAEGGWVDGKGLIHGASHASGGVKIEAEGSEYITKGKYAKPNAAILEAINTGSWEKYKMENIITPAINQVLEGGMGGLGGSATLNSAFNDKNLLRGTDRLRDSNKQGFIYLGDRLERVLKSRASRWN